MLARLKQPIIPFAFLRDLSVFCVKAFSSLFPKILSSPQAT
jgi:hypothetical protein